MLLIRISVTWGPHIALAFSLIVLDLVLRLRLRLRLKYKDKKPNQKRQKQKQKTKTKKKRKNKHIKKWQRKTYQTEINGLRKKILVVLLQNLEKFTSNKWTENTIIFYNPQTEEIVATN